MYITLWYMVVVKMLELFPKRTGAPPTVQLDMEQKTPMSRTGPRSFVRSNRLKKKIQAVQTPLVRPLGKGNHIRHQKLHHFTVSVHQLNLKMTCFLDLVEISMYKSLLETRAARHVELWLASPALELRCDLSDSRDRGIPPIVWPEKFRFRNGMECPITFALG